jgi:hypothetical protein
VTSRVAGRRTASVSRAALTARCAVSVPGAVMTRSPGSRSSAAVKLADLSRDVGRPRASRDGRFRLAGGFLEAGRGFGGRRTSRRFAGRARRISRGALETLQQQERGVLILEPVAIDDTLDTQYKAGLYRQTAAFLAGERESLCSLGEHHRRLEVYARMAGYPD